MDAGLGFPVNDGLGFLSMGQALSDATNVGSWQSGLAPMVESAFGPVNENSYASTPYRGLANQPGPQIAYTLADASHEALHSGQLVDENDVMGNNLSSFGNPGRAQVTANPSVNPLAYFPGIFSSLGTAGANWRAAGNPGSTYQGRGYSSTTYAGAPGGVNWGFSGPATSPFGMSPGQSPTGSVLSSYGPLVFWIVVIFVVISIIHKL